VQVTSRSSSLAITALLSSVEVDCDDHVHLKNLYHIIVSLLYGNDVFCVYRIAIRESRLYSSRT
jgi:hypothetical protein